MAYSPHVAILLCTWNGGRFLSAQLDSLAAQNHAHWTVWASDDGSQDNTLDILEQYQKQWGTERLNIVQGPATGPAANFLSLIHNDNIQADYFAYCDQDDIWHVDKLACALAALHACAATPQPPLLYGSRTRYVDVKNNAIGYSPLFRRPPGFANALVQNIAGGNTMVFNRTTRGLLQCVPSGQAIVMHDWWTYIVTTGCGGRMIYDPTPRLRYRQHDANEIGGNTGLGPKLRRLKQALQGRLRKWNDIHFAALSHLDAQLSDDAKQCLAHYRQTRDSEILTRLHGLHRSGVFRQQRDGQMALTLMALLGRL